MKLTSMNEAVFYFAIANNPQYLKQLLNVILKESMNIEIDELNPLNTKLLKDYMKSKNKYLDYLVNTDKGIINIEINNYYNKGIIKRNLTYLCQLVANSSIRGEDYITISNTIQVNFNRLGKKAGPFQVYSLKAENSVEGYENELSDIIKVIVINIDYFKKMYYNGNKKFIKKYALICALDLPLEELETLAKENELVMEYKKKLELLSNDEDFVKWITPEEEEEKMKKTYIEMGKEEGLEQGIEQGIEDGIAKGKINEKLEIAKKMLSEKCEIEFISKMTGLSIDEINEIII